MLNGYVPVVNDEMSCPKYTAQIEMCCSFVELGLRGYNQRAMSTAVERAVWWLMMPVRAVALSATVVFLVLIPTIVVIAGIVGAAWFAIDFLV